MIARGGGRTRSTAQAGFTLVEVALALALIAFLAGLALPGLLHANGTAAVRVSALEIASLLRNDRSAAIRIGTPVTTMVTRDRIRSGAGAAVLIAPSGIVLHAPPAIRFLPDGRSSGGEIAVASAQATVLVAISPDTGGIDVRLP